MTPTRYRTATSRIPHRRMQELVAVLLALLAGTVQAAIIRVGQPGETGCDHFSLQAAINTAATAPGLDIIRVSAGTYAAQRLLITDSDDLAIEGGFLSCSTPVANAGVTTLSGEGANPAGSVISHVGSGRLTLADLDVTAGDASAGGGVHSAGAAPLTLARVHLYSNRANAGGGLAVIGVAGTLKPVDLLGVAFTSNIADSIGGGIYALNADIRITGDEVNQFSGNWAQGTNLANGGGAIYANNSQLFIHSLAPTQAAFMDSNLATQGSGGAIAFVGSQPGFYFLTVMNRSASQPLRFANNAAARGGALAVTSGGAGGAVHVNATLYNAIVENNSAIEGAAFHIGATDSSHTATSSVGMLPSTPGMVAPLCPASLRCNRVQANQSSFGTVDVQSSGTLGHASFSLFRGHMLDNSSDGSLVSGTGYMSINNSVIANNLTGNANLFGNVGNELRIENSTIAGNIIGAPEVFAVILPGGALTVHNSIVFQPGKQFHLVGTPVVVNLRNLLVNADHGLDDLFPRNIQNTADPSFVNPGQDDFRPQPSSQAINRWSPGGGVIVPSLDLLGAARPADPPGTPTPYDFGAYEFGAVVDAIFSNGFDG